MEFEDEGLGIDGGGRMMPVVYRRGRRSCKEVPGRALENVLPAGTVGR